MLDSINQINNDLGVPIVFLILAECVQTAIYPALFVCGLTVPHALKVVRVQLVNVVA